MTLKGNAYTNTTWAYQERPVASDKLNAWDTRIETALDLVYFLLARAWGGGDGVLRNVTDDDLAVTAQSPPGLSVVAGSGAAFISCYPYRLVEAMETVDVVAPTTNPRIDLVQARLATWDVDVKQGIEGASPVAPDPDADCLALAELYLRPAASCIKNADDGTNGYITDVRAFI